MNVNNIKKRLCKCGAINEERNPWTKCRIQESSIVPEVYEAMEDTVLLILDADTCIDMETKKTEKDVTKSYKKLWKNAEYILFG